MQKLNKETTIYDIAKLLQLSSATVSRALQDNPVISHSTRTAVQETAQKLGYRRNNYASNLREQKTHTIGILIHELQSNFIKNVLSGIEKITYEAGYDLLIAHSNESFEKEKNNAFNLFNKRVEGLITSLSFNTQRLDHFKPFLEKGIPVIFFDRVEESSEGTKVIIDNYKCGMLATQHLIDQGCKKIALVTASLNRNVYTQRYNGYKDALKSNKLPFNEEYVLIKDLSEKSGIEAAHDILRMHPMPDGVFITNDFTAAVCMQVLKDHGIRVPDDIAIVGFNNDAIATIVEPQLSTINYPGHEIGQVAAQKIISHLEGVTDILLSDVITINANLIVRKSSLKR